MHPLFDGTSNARETVSLCIYQAASRLALFMCASSSVLSLYFRCCNLQPLQLVLQVHTMRDGLQAAEADIWEPVSPKRHLSLRRRAADAEAKRVELEGTMFGIPVHDNPFAPLQEEEAEAVLEPGACAEDAGSRCV